MSQTKHRRQSRQQCASGVNKQESHDKTRSETVLLIAPGEPNPSTLSAIAREWVAPRLAGEFLCEHRNRLAKNSSEVEVSSTEP
ncbi:MAG TPA: hypothetical protein VN577_14605 [Terriglobales bacterium]|nr:hypothetical protein [Terriglobales bacterium]